MAKRECAILWWNPAAQMRPVFASSSFAPMLMLPYRTCLHSASSVLAVHISCRNIAVFVFRKPLFNNLTLLYSRSLHEYHVIYSIRYYPLFHVTGVGLGMYYLRIWGHTCTKECTPHSVTHTKCGNEPDNPLSPAYGNHWKLRSCFAGCIFWYASDMTEGHHINCCTWLTFPQHLKATACVMVKFNVGHKSYEIYTCKMQYINFGYQQQMKHVKFAWSLLFKEKRSSLCKFPW
jgi:hypothetical protein